MAHKLFVASSETVNLTLEVITMDDEAAPSPKAIQN
jgi:hypothetical protein